MSRKKILRTAMICCILLLGVVFRVVEPMVFPETMRGGRGHFGDSITYVQMARNILQGNGFSTRTLEPYQGYVGRAPGYSLFLAACFALFGEDYRFVRGVQGLLGCLGGLISWVWFRRLKMQSHLGLEFLFLAFVFLNPYAVWVNAAVLPDALAGFFLILALFAVWTAQQRGRGWVMAGCLLACLSLIRPEYMLLAPTLAGFFLFRHRRKMLLPMVMLNLAFVLAVLPWTLRNFSVAKRFIPIAQGSVGCGLLLGWAWSPNDFRGFFDFPQGHFSTEEKRQEAFSLWVNYWKYFNREGSIMGNLDGQMKTLAVSEMRSHPVKLLRRTTEHLGALWFFTPYGLYFDQPNGNLAVWIFILGGLGLIFGKNVGVDTRLLLCLPVFYLSGVLCLILADSRYSIAAQPLLALLAAAGLQALQKKNGGDERIRTAE